MCICSELERLRWNPLTDGEPCHVKDNLEAILELIHEVLSESTYLASKLSYQVKLKKTALQRRRAQTVSIFKANFDDGEQRRLFQRFKDNPRAFWTLPEIAFNPTSEQALFLEQPIYSVLNTCLRIEQSQTHQVLYHRLSCVIIWILSEFRKYEPRAMAEAFRLAGLFLDQPESVLQDLITRLRDRGRKIVNILQQLGIGALWCCPLSIAPSAQVDHQDSHFTY